MRLYCTVLYSIVQYFTKVQLGPLFSTTFVNNGGIIYDGGSLLTICSLHARVDRLHYAGESVTGSYPITAVVKGLPG